MWGALLRTVLNSLVMQKNSTHPIFFTKIIRRHVSISSGMKGRVNSNQHNKEMILFSDTIDYVLTPFLNLNDNQKAQSFHPQNSARVRHEN